MTPLERAARAVADEISYADGDGERMVEGGLRGEDFFRGVARAVIEAIREPSEGMVATGSSAAAARGACIGLTDAQAIFEAMVRRLLAEGGK